MTPTIPLDTVTGRYELSNNDMLTLVPNGASLFTDVNGLPEEEFIFMGGDRFGSTQRDVSFSIVRELSAGPVGQLAGVRRVTYMASHDVNGRIERHGGAVATVLFYRLETAERFRYILVHVAPTT